MNLAILNKENSIKQAIKTIRESSISIGLVLDEKVLIGVVTQGDILKYIYGENSLIGSVNDFMTINYVFVTSFEKEFLDQMHKKYKIPYIPIIDEKRNLIGLSSVFSDKIIYINKQLFE